MNETGRKRVLILSYHFPPHGGPGVQRALKFAKFLPQFGWDPVILTVKDANYLVFDYSLMGDLPPEAQVVRSGSLDPMRLTARLRPRRSPAIASAEASQVAVNQRFREGSVGLRGYRIVRDLVSIPDIYAGWIPFAFARGLRAMRRQRCDAILGMIGPNSAGPLARLLSARTGVPYVLDFRDGWTDDPDAIFPTAWHRRLNVRLERWSVERAVGLTVYGEPCRASFAVRYPFLAERIEVVTNGFDREDLDAAGPPAPRAGNTFRLVFMGSLNAVNRAGFEAFLVALRLLPAEVADRLEVEFIGRTYAGAIEAGAGAGLARGMTFTSYLPHVEALRRAASADAMLLFVRKDDPNSLTGKLFEYLMMGRPILGCLEPTGACAAILRQAGHGRWTVEPDCPSAIAAALADLAASPPPVLDPAAVEQFSRRRNTGKLAAMLDQAVGVNSSTNVGEA